MKKLDQKMKEFSKVIIDAMENNKGHWTKGWNTIGISDYPKNAVSNKDYQGSNVFMLWFFASSNGFTCNQYATFNQVKKLGGSIIKGSKGQTILCPKMFTNEDILSKDYGKTFIAGFYPATVFNLEQTTGLENLIETVDYVPTEIETIANVEKFIANTKANIKFGGDIACYRHSIDTVGLPNIDQFHSTNSYYSTALHELIHWTMHKSRCNREIGMEKTDYAFEELIAESGSAMLCMLLGITTEPRPDHAKYLNSWIKRIKDNPKVIFDAFKHAQTAVNYLYSLQDIEEVKKVA